MRRRAAAILVGASLALAACGGEGTAPSRLTTIYEEQGLFTAGLPSDQMTSSLGGLILTSTVPNSLDQVRLVSGVASQPQTQTQTNALFGAGLGQAQGPQFPIYVVAAVDPKPFQTVEDMAVFFATGSPEFDVRLQEPVSMGGPGGLLVVQDGPEFGVTEAWALRLDEEHAYVILGQLSLGSWEENKREFLDIVASFRPGMHPIAETFPLFGPLPPP